MNEAVLGHFGETPMGAMLFTLDHGVLAVPTGQPLIPLGRRVRGAHQEEVAALRKSQGPAGLLAVEIAPSTGT